MFLLCCIMSSLTGARSPPLSWNGRRHHAPFIEKWTQLLPEAAPLLSISIIGRPLRVGPSSIALISMDNVEPSRLDGIDHRCSVSWLLLLFRRKALSKCGRARRSLHRDGDHLARSLDLAAPRLGSFILAEGHKKVWRSAQTKALRQAAMASGCSYGAPTRSELRHAYASNLVCAG